MNPEDIIGQVSPPPGVAAFNDASGGDIGIFAFLSLLIRVGTVVAGIYVLYNFFMAGFEYITAGDGKGGANARDKMTNSIIGLVIIVAAYTIIGLLGLIFFDNATYFINPQICGPAGCSVNQGTQTGIPGGPGP